MELQENTGQRRLFGNPAGRQQVNIAKLVLVLAEVFNLDQALGDQGVQTIVDAAKADAQRFAHLTLRQVWIGFQDLHQTEVGVLMEFGPTAGH